MKRNILLIPISLITFLIILEISLRLIWFQIKSDDTFALNKAYSNIQYKIQNFIQLNFVESVDNLAGINLNKKAWEASYFEAGLKIPLRGPREGFWGDRIYPKNTQYPGLDFIEEKISLDTLLQIDNEGVQYSRNFIYSEIKVLIIGGSVAFGAYASSISTTYYEILANELSNFGVNLGIAVLATGGWSSYDELTALISIGVDIKPDYVLLLDGLNDLTNLGNDYKRQIDNYLINLDKIIKVTDAYQIKLIVCPQPFIEFKKHPSVFEKRIMTVYKEFQLEQFYSELLRRNANLCNDLNIDRIDCSNLFSAEKITIFVDYWHFSDYAHRKLAVFLSENISEILNKYEQ